MKHGTNISLAWPVSLHMYHFISQHLELQAVSYSPSKLAGEWVYEHCYNIMKVLRGEQQWEWQWNIAVQAYKNETKIFHFYPHLTLHFPQRNAFVQRLTRARNNSQSMDNVWTDWGVARSTFHLAGHVDRSHSIVSKMKQIKISMLFSCYKYVARGCVLWNFDLISWTKCN